MLTRSLLVATLCLLAGCSKGPKMTVPVYPGAGGRPTGPVEQIAGGRVFHVSSQTADSMPMVRTWYEAELVAKLHWTLQPSGIGAAWHNGNMRWLSGGGSAGRVEVDDPTTAGGFVQVVEMQDTTQIETWQFVPTPPAK